MKLICTDLAPTKTQWIFAEVLFVPGIVQCVFARNRGEEKNTPSMAVRTIKWTYTYCRVIRTALDRVCGHRCVRVFSFNVLIVPRFPLFGKPSVKVHLIFGWQRVHFLGNHHSTCGSRPTSTTTAGTQVARFGGRRSCFWLSSASGVSRGQPSELS